MDRIIILIIVYLIACYIWKKIDCSRHKKIHNAVHTFFTRQSNNISMIAHKIIYVEFNGVIQPMITIILIPKVCLFQ